MMLILIIDTFHCDGEHSMESFWHISEKCTVIDRNSEAVIITQSKKIINFKILNKGLSLTSYFGQAQPPRGWISRSFGDRIPCTTLVADGKISGQTSLKYRIRY